MGATQVPASTSDNWVQISSVTPTAGVSTLSFTSISSYKKLLLSIRNPGQSGTAACNLTFNSDTGANYAYSALGNSSGTLATSANTTSASNIVLGTGGTGVLYGNLTIDEANTTGLKNVSGFYMNGTSGAVPYPSLSAIYFGSAAISTVTLTLTGGATFAASGTVALYGVAA